MNELFDYTVKLLLIALGCGFWAWWIIWDNEQRRGEAERERREADDE